MVNRPGTTDRAIGQFMHLSVTCPHCLNRYQVEPNLRGLHMRCPNPLCRGIFEVREEEPASSPPAPPPIAAGESETACRQVSGTVGEVVPMVQAEAVTSQSGPPAWNNEPPPVRRPQGNEIGSAAWPKSAVSAPPAPAAEVDDFLSQVPEAPAAKVEVAQEMGPGTWEAPPVRGPAAAQEVTGPARSITSSTPERTGKEQTRRTRRRMRWLAAALLLLLAGGLSAGFWIARESRSGSEAERFQKAKELYQERSFSEVEMVLQNLLRDFPDSKHRARYRLLAEWSDVREAVSLPQGSPEETSAVLGRVFQFLQVYRGDPLLEPYEGDIWLTLHKLARELTAEAERKKDRLLLDRARRALAEAGKHSPPAGTNPLDTKDRAEKKLADVEGQIALGERRTALVARLKQFLEKPATETVQEARALVADSPFKNDSELHALLQDLVKGHKAQVTYTPVTAKTAEKPVAIDREPSFLVVPLVHKTSFPKTPETASLFALARGVLYALEPRTGAVRWARRLGVDTSLLPLRLPESAIVPEIALVLSSDRKALWALNADNGDVVWEHPMQDVCVGQPVLAGNRLLVPTYEGKVDEIEIASGKLLGYYHLGQTLTVGGVLQQGTSLAYFPADRFTIYILDTARRQCAGILYSGHPNGSLRSAPVILSQPGPGPDPGGAGGLLILSQADGLDAVKLRTFALPIGHPDQPALEPEVRAPGWSWFPPYQDGERLALASDAGALALLGICQKGNRDPYLFPLFNNEVVLESPSRLGRALVVHADAENFWVLVHGRLHRLQTRFTRKAGPGIFQRWPEPLTLGSPLHAAQVRPEGPDKTLLFLVTQSPNGQNCLASAIEANSKQIYWQRQLGFSSQAQPLSIGPDVLAVDAQGLFRFNSREIPDGPLKAGGTRVCPFSPKKNTRCFLLSGEKGKSAHVLRFSERSLDSWHWKPDGETIPHAYSLSHPLAGTPGLGSDCLVLPLANGILERLPLGDGPAVPGPDWKAAGVDAEGTGHVVSLGGGDFLVTDGGRGLVLLHWGDPRVYQPRTRIRLPHRIVAPPAVLPAKKDQKNRVGLADAAGVLTLLEGDNLVTVRTWQLQGPITSGPFVRAGNIGCVVAKNRLVWIDPDRKRPLWEYAFPAEVVGQPQLVEDMLVVADLAGQFLAFDPASGKRLGPGYTLLANAPPAAAPVPFGNDRLLVPLMDGTIMLLARKMLRAAE